MGDDIGPGSVTGCRLWLLGDDILSCTELHYCKNQNKRNRNQCHPSPINYPAYPKIGQIKKPLIITICIEFNSLQRVGKKSGQYFVGFLEELRIPLSSSEI